MHLPHSLSLFCSGVGSDSVWLHGPLILFYRHSYVKAAVAFSLSFFRRRSLSGAGFRGIQSQVRLLALCIHYAIRVAIGLGYSWDQLAKKGATIITFPSSSSLAPRRLHRERNHRVRHMHGQPDRDVLSQGPQTCIRRRRRRNRQCCTPLTPLITTTTTSSSPYSLK